MLASGLKAAVTALDKGVVLAREHIVRGDVVDGAMETHAVVVLDIAGDIIEGFANEASVDVVREVRLSRVEVNMSRPAIAVSFEEVSTRLLTQPQSHS